MDFKFLPHPVHLTMIKKNIRSWGNYPKKENTAYSFDSSESLKHIIHDHNELIPYGNGRSYGDSALNDHIVTSQRYNHFLDFDESTGVLSCQAGVLLSDIVKIFVPRGWFLQTTPGTKFITVGGAIASDVHGKNHHVAGSFSDSLIDFRLMLPDGTVVTCSKDTNVELFKATCGGMGLTGVILDGRVKLQRVQSSMIDMVMVKTRNLEETFESFEEYKSYPYSVAWIDCLAQKKSLGRCLLGVGNHATDGNLKYNPKQLFSVPFNFPSFTLNNLTVKLFNEVYYHKVLKKISRQKTTIDSFFYPLDAVGEWNRVYGSKGLTQYQCVLPEEGSFTGMEKILTKISGAGRGTFLAVLKKFGKGNDNYLSFPMEGVTLALDFKIDRGLFEFFNDLDKIVLDYGGRIYLTKDVRVSKEVFEKGYPQINKFRELRTKLGLKGKIESFQSKRLDL